MIRLNRNRLDDDTLVDRWLTKMQLTTRADPRQLAESCRDIVESFAHQRPEVLHQALTRFGNRFGAEGWALNDVSRWIADLSDLGGTSLRQLDRFDSGVALARGWASGYMHGTHSDEYVDALTGLVTLPVLRLRLTQVYEQCEALSVPTDQVYCLVVIDTDLPDRTPLERDAAMVVVAEQTRGVFHSGETVAVCEGRILVLASRTDATRDGLLDILSALKVYPLFTAGGAFGWLEDLPLAESYVDSYLADVTT